MIINRNVNMEQPRYRGDQEQIGLREAVAAYLSLPDKRNYDNPDANLAQNLGGFLVNQGYIRKIAPLSGSWGFMYEDKTISIGDQPISKTNYEHYFFRLGQNPQTREPLYPTGQDETDCYRFLHEVSHAYQDYLTKKENPTNPDTWYQKAASGELDSPFAVLFGVCAQIRQKDINRGLSTWGNVPDYAADRSTELAARTIDDANELVTMYLWNPEYFNTYLDYLAGDYPGYGDQNLEEDGLTKLTPDGKELIRTLVMDYIEEMKQQV